MTLIRSLLFNIVVFAWTFLVLVLYIPLVIAPRATLLSAIRLWVCSVFRLQRLILGLDFEFRGTDNLPDGPCIVASAHQSAWDTIAFYAVWNDPGFVLKHELYRIPMFGLYARRLDMIAIDRAGGAAAARQMLRDVRNRFQSGQPVVIFPGGTRSAPGDIVPLKSGVTALYRRSNVPVVPVSLNSGYFWGRRSFTKKSGKIVAEFHEPIQPGLGAVEFADLLAARIDGGNKRLLDEARNTYP